MVRVLPVSILALAASSWAAMAADLPGRGVPLAPAPAYAQPAPIFTWTGLYVGGTIGGAFGGQTRFTDVSGYNAAGAVDRLGAVNSVTGGATLGYNYQFGSVVVGAEGDVNFLNGRASAPAAASPGLDTRYRVDNTVLGTVRGRVGSAFDRFLVYGTGGLAFLNTRYSVTDTCAAAPCGAGTIAGTGSAAPTTWTVGGGLEYAISRNWSVKGEYLYVAAPSKNFVGVTGAGATDAFQARGGATNIARLGVNYRF